MFETYFYYHFFFFLSFDRFLPYLEVVGGTSLMSLLRWNYKTNMEETLCSSDSGEIVLVDFSSFSLFFIFFSKLTRYLSIRYHTIPA